MRKRLDGGGRKLWSEELENALFEWIKKCRAEKQVVTRKHIKFKARAMAMETGEIDFGARNGWLTRFMTRKRLSLHRVTTACQKEPNELAIHITNFIYFVQNLRLQNQYPLELIYGADECGVLLDGLAEPTVDFVGTREVAVKTAGKSIFCYLI